MAYTILIKRQNHTTLKEIEKYFKTTFKSYDYMTGFLDGYLFDNYKILSLDEIEMQFNSGTNLDDYYIKFVTVLNGEIEE